MAIGFVIVVCIWIIVWCKMRPTRQRDIRATTNGINDSYFLVSPPRRLPRVTPVIPAASTNAVSVDDAALESGFWATAGIDNSASANGNTPSGSGMTTGTSSAERRRSSRPWTMAGRVRQFSPSTGGFHNRMVHQRRRSRNRNTVSLADACSRHSLPPVVRTNSGVRYNRHFSTPPPAYDDVVPTAKASPPPDLTPTDS